MADYFSCFVCGTIFLFVKGSVITCPKCDSATGEFLSQEQVVAGENRGTARGKKRKTTARAKRK